MKRLLLICCGLLLALGVQAQGMKDPSAWTFKVMPAKDAYDLVLHVKLEPGWHVWSANPGGDGSLIGTSVSFEPGKYTLEGPLHEMGKLVETAMDAIDGNVRYYSGEADFIQTVQAKSGETVKGTFTYQLCNDMMCLPPKTKPFEFRIP